MRRVGWALLLAAGLAGGARGDDVAEPPPEAGEGDYALEARDSLERGVVELGVGAGGRVGGGARSLRRLRFRGEGASGSLREGDDPLRGGRVDAAAAGGRLRMGRLAPRWGRGLLLGGAAEPWATGAADRGDAARFVGRAGEGATWSRGAGRGELLAGRFARQRLVGARAAIGPGGAGFLAHPRGGRQASLALGEDASAAEFALDHRGHWRFELALAATDSAGPRAIVVRAGRPGFHSLAEPTRSGPSHAVAAWAAPRIAAVRWSLAGAAWSFGPGQEGARFALAGARALGSGARAAAGAEEQRGPRREAQPSAGPRRGVHAELRLAGRDLALALRDEWWGERPWARAAVRRVMAVRADVALPGQAALVVVHAAWRAASGERLWLADATRDGLVLRSATGAGERTRLELTVPVRDGAVRLGAGLERREGSSRAPTWTAEWTRRGRL